MAIRFGLCKTKRPRHRRGLSFAVRGGFEQNAIID
jgi:hypothetical protein